MIGIISKLLNNIKTEMQEGTIKKKYPVDEKATPGNIVRVVSGNKIKDLPLNQHGIIATASISNNIAGPRYYRFKLTDTKSAYFYQRADNGYLAINIIDIAGDIIQTTETVLTSLPTGISLDYKIIDMNDGTYVLVYLSNNKICVVAISVDASTNQVIVGTPLANIDDCTGLMANPVTKLNNNQIIIFYNDSANSRAATAVSITKTGLSLTSGTPVVVEASNRPAHSVVRCTNTSALVIYKYSTAAAYARVLTVSGNVITVNTQITFSTNDVVSAISYALADNYILTYYAVSSVTSLFYQKFIISGTSITNSGQASYDTGTLGSSSVSNILNIMPLTTTGRYVLFVFNGNYSALKAAIIDLGNVGSTTYTNIMPMTTIVGGTSSNSGYYIILQNENNLSDFIWVLGGKNNSSTKGYIGIGFLRVTNDNSISMVSDYVLDIPHTIYPLGAGIMAGEYYKNDRCLIGVFASDVKKMYLVRPSDLEPGKSNVTLGLLQSDGFVVLRGIVKGLSGLNIGSTYYHDRKGFLTTTATNNVRVGKAISETELLMDVFLPNLTS